MGQPHTISMGHCRNSEGATVEAVADTVPTVVPLSLITQRARSRREKSTRQVKEYQDKKKIN